MVQLSYPYITTGKIIALTMLIYNVVLVSAVQQRDYYTYVFFLIFLFIMLYHKILNIVPCVCSRTLLFIHYIYIYIYTHTHTHTNLHLLIPNSLYFPTCIPFQWQPQFIDKVHLLLCAWLFLIYFDGSWSWLCLELKKKILMSRA